MPYASNADLPASVKSHLPEHAQDISRRPSTMLLRVMVAIHDWRKSRTASPGRR